MTDSAAERPTLSATEYLTAAAHVGLALVAVYLSSRFGASYTGRGLLAAVCASLAAAGLVAGALLAGARFHRGRLHVFRRTLGAVAIGFSAAATYWGLAAAAPVFALIGLAAGPDLRLLFVAERDRRAAGEPYLFPDGFPRLRLVAAVLSPLVVLAAHRPLGELRATLLGGALVALWALASTSLSRDVHLRRRLVMAAAALPALVLGLLTNAPPVSVLAAVGGALLAWRVRRWGELPAAATLLLAASFSLTAPQLRWGRISPGYSPLRIAHSGSAIAGGREAVAVRHRKTGAYQVFSRGMELYTDQNDARFSESLVHPAMALAPERARVLVVGGGCTGVLSDLAKYKKLAQVDWLRLHPGIDRFCRSIPAIASKLGVHPAGLRVFRADRPTEFVEAFKARPTPYDVVLVYGPDPPLSPPDMHSSGFYDTVRSLLAPQGILAARVGTFDEVAVLRCAMSRIQDRWLHLIRYYVPAASKASADTNVFVLASALPPAVDTLRFRVPARVLTPALFRAWTSFFAQVRWDRVPEPEGGCTRAPSGSGR